jgi:hypothetical protein
MPSKTRKINQRKGRGPKKSIVRIPISRNNDLGKYGYKNILQKTISQRHKALMRVVGSAGKKLDDRAAKTRKIIQKLNALSIVQKNTNPEFSEKVRDDQKYMSDYLEELNKKIESK